MPTRPWEPDAPALKKRQALTAMTIGLCRRDDNATTTGRLAIRESLSGPWRRAHAAHEPLLGSATVAVATVTGL